MNSLCAEMRSDVHTFTLHFHGVDAVGIRDLQSVSVCARASVCVCDRVITLVKCNKNQEVLSLEFSSSLL